MTAPGPRVFLDYDQAGLDAAYDQAVYAPNRAQIAERCEANSDAARARIGAPRHATYGPGSEEYVEIYPAPVAGAPIFVFIHGGAWRHTGTARYAYAAELFVNAGTTFVAVQFNGVDHTDGELRPIVDQVRRAVAWVHANARTFGGDPQRMAIGGHSSGAHLTSVVLLTDWSAYGAPPGLLKAALCCSGMYDLAPVSLSKRSAYVRFDDALVEALSAQRHIARIPLPVIVACGTYESPEFQRQARDFAAALDAAGKLAQLIVAPGYNHFELIETIASPYGLIGRAALAMMP